MKAVPSATAIKATIFAQVVCLPMNDYLISFSSYAIGVLDIWTFAGHLESFLLGTSLLPDGTPLRMPGTF
jgi:hypothetical protein